MLKGVDNPRAILPLVRYSLFFQISYMRGTGAGFGVFQDKLVALNKGFLYLDDVLLSPWLLMFIIKQLHFQMRY